MSERNHHWQDKAVDAATILKADFFCQGADGANRLVVRKKYGSGSLSQTRHFYHTAGWQTIEERLESDGSILSTADRQCTWGQRYIDDLLCRTVNSVHDYAYQDANWNVILSSTTLARVVYQPYGQIRSTSPAASGDLDAWQHYFAGYRRDEDTGLYLVRHRVYQPELGCWGRRDSGFTDGINVYEYVGANPALLGDSGGLSWRDECFDACRKQYRSDHNRFKLYRCRAGCSGFQGNWWAEAEAACGKYDKYVNSKCWSCVGYGYVVDDYPKKAREVCKRFMKKYERGAAALCVANCLTDAEALHATYFDCRDRNAARFKAHFKCYWKCRFLPGKLPKPLPDGSGAVAGVIFLDVIVSAYRSSCRAFAPHGYDF